MAQTSDSQPTHPVIVFQVNLGTQDSQGHLVPNRTQLHGNETTTEAAAQSDARSTYIPGLMGAENIKLKHGDQFTVKGLKALYLKTQHVSSPASADDLLIVVSQT